MDPNAVLANMREFAAKILASEAEDGRESFAAVDLAAAVENLDTWLKGGGFLPSEWNSTSRG